MRSTIGFKSVVFCLFSLLISRAVVGTDIDGEKSVIPGPIVYENGVFNLEAIASGIQQCEVVKELNQHVESHHNKDPSIVQRFFTALFPFDAGWNAILATIYISGPPNLILALIPPNIDPESLSTLVSFAVGGLLGDVFLHLLPQTFVGEVHDEHVRFILVEEKRNLVLGFSMFIGFASFVILDKLMRIMSGGHEHSHSHSHDKDANGEFVDEVDTVVESISTSVEVDGARRRVNSSKTVEIKKEKLADTSNSASSIKLSAYLNLIADFTHNITDGLAIAASFYISKNVGATTFLAVFFHGE